MIISFYSYKGGVGRTQLAVNLASYLCYHKGLKILLIDWDLEAPGLHYYFKKEEIQHKGIIELFLEFENKFQNTTIKEAELPKLDETYIVKNISKQLLGSGKIDLITAGYYDETYKEYNNKVNTFNWQNFYEKLDGVTYIEYLKKELKNLNYDFIFIDSRTGVSDYSGIVNVQMPDVNVLIIAPTKQNFAGSFRIADNIKNSNYIQKGYRKPIIMPILSRIDLSIEQKSDSWLSDFKKTFGKYIQDFCKFTGLREDEYISDTLLDYKRDISFGEQILFTNRFSSINDKTLARQYQLISDYLLKLKNPNTKIIRQINDTKIESKSSAIQILLFGDSGVGKTSILMSFLSFLYSSENLMVHINPNNVEGTRYLDYLLRTKTNRSLPISNNVENIVKLDFGFSVTDDIKLSDKKENSKYLFSIYDLSGERLSNIDISKKGRFDDDLSEIISDTNIYLLITDVDTANFHDKLIWQFLNYCVNKQINLEKVCLVINKWDLVKKDDKINLKDFVSRNMPQTSNWFKSNYIENSLIISYSCGYIPENEDFFFVSSDDNGNKMLLKWLIDQNIEKNAHSIW